MNRVIITAALAIAVATPSFAGGWDYDGPPYGCNAPGACRLPGPGAYGGYGYIPPYAYMNGGNGYRPPPPPVPVEPAWCSPRDTVFVPRFNKWMCKPVLVPRAQ